MLQNASLDTSFWAIASQIGTAPYLFSLFQVYYCSAVEQEIVTTDPEETTLVYPQAMLFRVMQEAGKLQQMEPYKHLTMFGLGEAHAIALAQEQSWWLLINDYRPLQFAVALGIRCVSVPDFCLLLYARKTITFPAVRGYLRRLAATTSPKLLQEALAAAESLAEKRGENR
jgi:predicted nucleic acid-binding protein